MSVKEATKCIKFRLARPTIACIYSSTPQIFPEGPLCAWNCSRFSKYSTKKDKWDPCSGEAYSLARERKREEEGEGEGGGEHLDYSGNTKKSNVVGA